MSEVRYHQVEPPVAIVVSHADTHAPLSVAIGVVGATRPGRHLLEGGVAPIPIQTVGRAVVGHVHIQIPIEIEVEADHPHRIPHSTHPHTGRLGSFPKRAVAIVEIEGVLALGQTARAIHDQHLAPPSPGALGGENLLPRRLDVVAYIQILIPILIGVEESGTDTPFRVPDPAVSVISVNVPSPLLRYSTLAP